MRREDRTWARALFKEFHPAPNAGAFEEWLDYVTQVDVDIRPYGRAILMHPELEQLWVELRWDANGVISALIEGPRGESLPRVEVCLSPFLAALELRRRAATRAHEVSGVGSFSAAAASFSGEGTSVSRPAAGKPPALAFYRRLLDEYDELISASPGVKAPVAVLAVRYGAKRDTVKSWLRRGGDLQIKGKI
jgi:hypothetical protein